MPTDVDFLRIFSAKKSQLGLFKKKICTKRQLFFEIALFIEKMLTFRHNSFSSLCHILAVYIIF